MTIILTIFYCGISVAGERIDLINSDKEPAASTGSGYILNAAWQYPDPYGEFDPSLGAAAALNRALGLIFTGDASRSQIAMEYQMVQNYDNDYFLMAPFAVDVLDALQTEWEDSFPEPVELKPFNLEPSEPPVIMSDNPHIVVLQYDDEEYLERLLQRLYFKLIQGPVLLTVPYRGDSPGVPAEFQNWNNFRYGDDNDSMEWNEVRYVWVDWDLTQTVVLKYEDGKIACYDSGSKYYIDHTAAITAAGAMLAHPDYNDLPDGVELNYVLAGIE